MSQPKALWLALWLATGLGWMLAGLAAAEATTPPAIPVAQFEALPAPVRAAIDEARARLENADAGSRERAALAAAWGQLGHVFFVHDFPDQARVSYQRAADLEPRRFDWPYLLAMVELAVSDLPAALAALDDALALDADNLPALVRRGRIHLENARLAPAQADFERALALAPNSPPALDGLGRVALASGDHATAVEFLQKALALEPTATRVHHSLGMAYRGQGQLDTAREHLERRGNTEPGLPDVLLARVQAESRSPQFLLQLGLARADQGDFEGALDMMARVLALDPDHAPAMTYSGELLARLGRLEGAHAVLQRLVAIQPTSTEAHFSLGQVEELRGKPEAARAAYRQALDIDPAHIGSRGALARLLLASGESDAAARAFLDLAEAGLDVESEARYRYFYGLAELRAARCPSAAEAFERAISTATTPTAELLDALVRVRSTCAQNASARATETVDLAERLYDAAPSLDSAETLAMAYARVGRFDDAIDLQMQAIFEALKANLLARRPELQDNLARYEADKHALQPYAETHPVFGASN